MTHQADGRGNVRLPERKSAVADGGIG